MKPQRRCQRVWRAILVVLLSLCVVAVGMALLIAYVVTPEAGLTRHSFYGSLILTGTIGVLIGYGWVISLHGRTHGTHGS